MLRYLSDFCPNKVNRQLETGSFLVEQVLFSQITDQVKNVDSKLISTTIMLKDLNLLSTLSVADTNESRFLLGSDECLLYRSNTIFSGRTSRYNSTVKFHRIFPQLGEICFFVNERKMCYILNKFAHFNNNKHNYIATNIKKNKHKIAHTQVLEKFQLCDIWSTSSFEQKK